MSDATVAGGVPFETLPDLTKAHDRLLERYNNLRLSKGAIEGDGELWRDVERFIEQTRATGVYLYDDSARWAAQGMLEYWSAALFRANKVPVEAVLMAFDPKRAELLPDENCPYVGLEAFRSEKNYHGRERLVTGLLKKLCEDRLLAVVGASGSGKSSLVMGGLLPELKAGRLDGSREWYYFPPIVPGANPLGALIDLFPKPDAASAAWKCEQEAALIAEPSRLREMVAKVTAAPAVLTVDQFEEVFTLCGNREVRKAFALALLNLASENDPKHIVVLTMRSDYKTDINRLPESFKTAFASGLVPITPMDTNELTEAIVKPAEGARLKFDEGVVESLVQDVIFESAALPLLQFTLLKLWENRDRNRVTRSAYNTLGGGLHALEYSAEELYKHISPQQQAALKEILLRMVKPVTGKEDADARQDGDRQQVGIKPQARSLEFTSKRVQLKELFAHNYAFETVKEVLKKLVENRLVRLTGRELSDSKTIVEGLVQDQIPEDAQAEVAHEALVRNWPRLTEWLSEMRDAMVIFERLEQRAEEWRRLGKESGGLLDKVQLAEAQQWLNSQEATRLTPSANVRELIEKSKQAIDAVEKEKNRQYKRLVEEQKQRADAERERADEKARGNRFMRWLIAALAVAVIFASITAWNTFWGLQASEDQRREAEALAKKTLSNQLAAQALFYMDKQLDLALLLSLQSIAVESDNPAGHNSLITILGNSSALRTFIQPPTDFVITGIAFDGNDALVGVDGSGNVRRWGLNGGPMESLSKANVGGQGLRTAISPDGKTLALFTQSAVQSSPPADTLTLLNAVDGTVKKSFTLEGNLTGLAFGPDGKAFAFAQQNADEGTNFVSVLNLETGALMKMKPENRVFTALAFSADGKVLAGGGDWGKMGVFLWELPSGRSLPQLPALSDDEVIIKLVFLSTKLYALFDDGAVGSWDYNKTRSGTKLPTGNERPITDIATTESGKLIAWCDSEGKIEVEGLNLFDVTKFASGSPVKSIAFSPDGKTLAVATIDNKLILWAMGNSQRPFVRTLSNQQVRLSSIAVSPDGKTLASTPVSRFSEPLHFWELTTGNALDQSVSERQLGRSTKIIYRSDGRALACNNVRSNDAALWLCEEGEKGCSWEVKLLGGHQNTVEAVAFSPDGHLLATGDAGGQIILRDGNSGEPIHAPLQAHNSSVYTLAFSPDGKTLVSGGQDGQVIFWQVESGTELGRVKEEGPIRDVAFSPNGHWLASCGDDKDIDLWDAATHAPSGRLEGHTARVTDLSFNPGGNILASGSWDGTVILWDVKTRSQMVALSAQAEKINEKPNPIRPTFVGISPEHDENPVPLGGVRETLFSPDGTTLFTLNETGSVSIWDVDFNEWMRRACEIANRNLSDSEKDKFMKDYKDFKDVCHVIP